MHIAMKPSFASVDINMKIVLIPFILLLVACEERPPTPEELKLRQLTYEVKVCYEKCHLLDLTGHYTLTKDQWHVETCTCVNF